jgi:hypothetical protein
MRLLFLYNRSMLNLTHVCLSPIEMRRPLHHSERPRCGSPEFPSTCIIVLVKRFDTRFFDMHVHHDLPGIDRQVGVVE